MSLGRRIIEWLQSRRERDTTKASWVVMWDNVSVWVRLNGEVVQRCRWDEVRQIVAYKDDVWAYDIINVAFVTQDECLAFRADEEFEGFCEFMLEFQRRFPDHNKEWYRQVMIPAFERCWTVVWDASEAKQDVEREGSSAG
ncbi:MAG: hypothetical protein IPK69_03345 [Phycisphaerales bacterium]|nr:MAG: hypothetical protein IPK69_03345 [Phycisphaerales bacterium]